MASLLGHCKQFYWGTELLQVNPTKCLGIEIESDLNRNVYVKELIKVFIQKLNLVWSLYFVPTTAITDFYFKVVLPSVTYGLVV